MKQSFLIRRRGEVLLFATATVLLFAFSWYFGLINSEDRWAQGAREMLIYKDWLHPALNAQIYFDKPPLSYWLAAGSGWLLGGVSEFAARLPSMLSALIGLWGTVWLARQMFHYPVGLLAGWVLLGCYGFLFLGRSAEADIQSMAAIIMACAWLYHCREKANFLDYLVFYAICFTGALTKGLPSVIVPMVAAGVLLLPGKLWLRHLRLSNLIALILGLGGYLLPFYLAGEIAPPDFYTWPENQLSGLELVWRENIVRALNPYDHKGEWYLYFYELPRLLIPWVPLFVAALIAYGRDFREADAQKHSLVWVIVAVFTLFSLSGSRRWYYILPALPFCTILCAVFLAAERKQTWEKWLILAMRYLFIVTASLMILAVVVFPFIESSLEIRLPWLLYIGTPVTGLLAFTVMLLDERKETQKKLARFFHMPPEVTGLLVGGALLAGGFFACAMPSFDSFRTTRPFVEQEIQPLIAGMPGENVIVLTPMLRGPLLYYMNPAVPLTTFDWPSNEDPDELTAWQDTLRRRIDENPAKVVVIVESRDMRKFLEAGGAMPDLLTIDWAAPDLEEPEFKLEKNKNRKVQVWVKPAQERNNGTPVNKDETAQ